MAMVFPGGSDDKESACNAGNLGLIPGSERSPGEGNGYPFKYSCLEDPIVRGARWDRVQELQSWTWLSDFHFSENGCILYLCLSGKQRSLVLGPELGWTWVSTKAVKAFLSKEQRLISFKFGFEMYWCSMGNGPDSLHLPLSKLLWLPDKFPHTPKCQSCFNSSPLLPPSLSLYLICLATLMNQRKMRVF